MTHNIVIKNRTMEIPAPSIEVKQIARGSYRVNQYITQLGDRINPHYEDDEGTFTFIVTCPYHLLISSPYRGTR